MDCASRSSRFVEEIRQYVTLGEYSTATQHVPLPRRMVSPFRWYKPASLAAPALLKSLFPGFAILTSTTPLFPKTSLHMPPSSLVLIGILAPSAGILGALLWPVLQRRLGLTSLRVLII